MTFLALFCVILTQSYTVCMFFIAAILIAAVIGKPYDIGEILEKIPESQRIEFLKEHIKLGYDLVTADSKTNKMSPLNLPELPKEFSIALYEYTRSEYRIQDDDLTSLLSNIICFPNGECIDVGDVGVHPRNIYKE